MPLSEDQIDSLRPLLFSGLEGVDVNSAMLAVHRIVEASDGEIMPSIEPMSGPNAFRDSSQHDVTWQVVISSEQRERVLRGQRLAPVSSLEIQGWSTEGLENFWTLDYLLANARRHGIDPSQREYFEEDAAESLRWLETDPTVEFTEREDGTLDARCPEVERVLGADDSWRAAMPMLLSLLDH